MSSSILPKVDVESLYASHGRYLWSVCYRMTGSVADADDLVQETFVRVMERPPLVTDLSLRPWLTRVAINLGRDLLRRRKRQGYPGTWLPSPAEIDDELLREAERSGVEPETPESRYGTMESLSYAFLIACERLTPSQRAVLLLRDVLEYGARDTASALAMSVANVKVTLHRARKKMESYDRKRRPPTAALAEETGGMLMQLLRLLSSGEFDQLEDVLASDVRALSDGGGVTPAARHAVIGRDKVGKLYKNLASRSSANARFDVRSLNGVPALVVEDPEARKPNATRFVFRIELDRDGLISEIHSVLAPRKLVALWPEG